MIDILFPAWLGAVILVLAAGPLGCFIIWHKLSCFGDTLAHSSILGIAFGLLLNINPYYTLIILVIMITFSLITIENRPQLTMDTFLGIVAYSTLSLGLVIISLIPNIRVDLIVYLFGDLLAINYNDIWIILIVTTLVLVILTWKWRPLLLITINKEMATVDGINVKYNRLILMFLTAMLISVAIKFVGALIVTALLIIPAATARYFAKSPEQMAIIAVLIGITSVTFGLIISAYYDTPAAPSVVLCSTCLFIFSLLYGKS
ncbi:zinc ABC transporter permease [Candidatus Pantoea edessiphila]|uniref:High-affinity zinc uptake system membrane protein ZnuB n=1 Tax=Candidatus Pantoea edessiphila TaxID=2044610 RepID=A0A2P5SYL9_9GAMM|nr:zinc ABC transporter permease subunit ZnuB [Candidatus Pantoea edessiphila]MBK4775440.1 zinc ABC transporter permease subunit ZnuB [Pantoea sp. Edef]PPI87431.1 zinc ABC transporter permease [Candidatus Pantoea edessiphila]